MPILAAWNFSFIMHFFTVSQLEKLGIPRKIQGLLLLHSDSINHNAVKFTALWLILSLLKSFVTLEQYSRTCFTNVRLKGSVTLPVSPQTAWFEVLRHYAEVLHNGRTRTFCYDLAALPVALFTEDGLMRTVQKLRGPGISVKMGSDPQFNWVFFDYFWRWNAA